MENDGIKMNKDRCLANPRLSYLNLGLQNKQKEIKYSNKEIKKRRKYRKSEIKDRKSGKILKSAKLAARDARATYGALERNCN